MGDAATHLQNNLPSFQLKKKKTLKLRYCVLCLECKNCGLWSITRWDSAGSIISPELLTQQPSAIKILTYLKPSRNNVTRYWSSCWENGLCQLHHGYLGNAPLEPLACSARAHPRGQCCCLFIWRSSELKQQRQTVRISQALKSNHKCLIGDTFNHFTA